MELFIVRHAQPAWSVDGLSQNDPELTDDGRTQARLLAETWERNEVGADELIVSSARRARETAAPLQGTLGLTPTVIPDLTEIKMPDFSDQPAALVERLFRDAYERPLEQWWDGMPGGETFREFHERITTATIDLLAARGIKPHGGHIDSHLWEVAEPDRRVVIVAHGGTNAVMLGFLLGLEPTPWEWERFVFGHTGVARLKMFPIAGSHIFSLRTMNDLSHVPEHLRTR